MQPQDPTGKELEHIVLSDAQFAQDTIEGFQQIEAGENTAITLEELQASLKNGKPIL